MYGLTATGCHGLWKCVHPDGNLLFKPQSRNEPCTLRSNDAMGMGFIDDELRVAIREDFLGYADELFQRTHVSVHAVDAFDSNKNTPLPIADEWLGIADGLQGVPEGV